MDASPAGLTARFDARVTSGAAAFSLSVELEHERGVLVLFGRSGTGKSLTLRALAGLITPTRGVITVGGRTLYDAEADIDVPPHTRKIGYVPQHQTLFPFLDVEENVAFGLPRAERHRGNSRVAGLLASLGLEKLARARPESLSGGERQRVAVARALAVEPSLLLLDEPLSAIDVEGKRELRATLRETIARVEIPTVLVTHDPADAVSLGDTLVRFERGRTAERGRPRVVLESLLSTDEADRAQTSAQTS